MDRLPIVLCLSLALLALQEKPEKPRPVRCLVVDQQGKPVPGVELFEGWLFPDPVGPKKDERASPMFPDDSLRNPLVTDEQGEFVWPANVDRLFALDLAHGRGAIVEARTENATLTVALQPLVDVHGRFDVQAVGEPPKTCALWIGTAAMSQGFLAACLTESRELRLALPPGDYRLWCSTDAENLYSMSQLDDGELAIPAGSGPVDLGARVLELPLIVHPRGVVLDGEGRPVAHPQVGPVLFFEDGRCNVFGHAETDEQGGFRCNVPVYDAERKQALVFLDPRQEQGAWLAWTPKTLAPELSVRLAPMVRVHGRFVVDGSDSAVSWTNVYLSSIPEDVRIAECRSTKSEFDFRLPPGRYRMNAYGTDVEAVNRELELSSESLDLDLGTIGLPLDVIARLKGHEAPAWTLTDARGIERTKKLSDYRGKWVLLEFWGYW